MFQEGSARYGYGVAPQRTTVSARAQQMARDLNVPPYLLREARRAFRSYRRPPLPSSTRGPPSSSGTAR